LTQDTRHSNTRPTDAAIIKTKMASTHRAARLPPKRYKPSKKRRPKLALAVLLVLMWVYFLL